MKYCTHCGAELFDEAIVCTKCGCATEVGGSNTSQEKWNGLTIAGFVVSFFSCIVGLILSIIALKQVKKSGENSKGMAIAGIIISSVSLAAIVLYVFILLLDLIIMLSIGVSAEEYTLLLLI